jgi:hypothetical protein
MKRKIVLPLLAVLIATVAFGFYGCGKTKAQTGGTASNIVRMQSFENMHDMYNVSYEQLWGRVELSEDHVSDGKYAAKLRLDSSLDVYSAPYIRCILSDAANRYALPEPYDLSDISKVDYFGFYFYNANEFAVSMQFNIVSLDGSIQVMRELQFEPDSGRDVRVAIDRAAAAERDDPAKCLTWVLPFAAGTYYIDNIYAETALAPVAAAERAVGDGTLLGFDTMADLMYVKDYKTYDSLFYRKDISIGRLANFNARGNLLAVRYVQANEINRQETVFPAYKLSGFLISEQFLRKVDFSALAIKSLKLDVFPQTAYAQKLTVSLKDSSGTEFKTVVTAAAGVWTTIEITPANVQASSLLLSRVNYFSVAPDMTFMLDATTTVYFDNLRLEV